MDLFSGCGGISLGFHRAGFDIVANVEIDPLAAASHAVNFHRDLPPEQQKLFAAARDIKELEPEDLLAELYPGEDPELLVDVIVGGPPCQAFARVGRAKLREVLAHPEAFRLDPRGNLYLRYLHYVSRLKPVALVMENVPDILNYGGHNIAEETAEALEELGYECRYTLLNAVFYGVPQMRERMFLVAIARELNITPAFPRPTHFTELPVGYGSLRKVAYRTLNQGTLFEDEERHLVEPPTAVPTLERAVSSEEAMGDLPPITLHLEGKLRKAPRRFDEMARYRSGEAGPYARLMREWPGFESPEGVQDHVIRYLPRDYEIFRRMKPGDQYPEAYRIAHEIFAERRATLVSWGIPMDEDSPFYTELFERTIPPYDANKFPNKWRKMEANQPARTLMAHLGKDSYSHIHYDSEQCRPISVREAARLQSFPDGFIFKGAMNPAFRQIGNAVPPILAWRVAQKVKETLEAGLEGLRKSETAIELHK
jgi:DNA (cytosine-5)-methyltransferase 1